MSQLAFSTYRLSIDDPEHPKALILALEKGCDLIVTAPNYMNGKSEKLVGTILEENPQFSPLILTKGGHLNAGDKKQLEIFNIEEDELFEIQKDHFYSLAEEALEYQIDSSLKHLKKETLDVFLIHNPEIYFQMKQTKPEELYKKIIQLFLFLEKMVTKNKIKSYGISSNSFSLQPIDSQFIDFEKLVLLANESIPKNNFNWIEFPLNLIERGALKQYNGQLSLIGKAKKYNIKTLTNRPLNAFREGEFVRLATYDKFSPPIDYAASQRKLEESIKLMENKIIEKNGNLNQDNYWLFTNLRSSWVNLHTLDQVEHVFNKMINPFLDKIGLKGHSKKSSQVFDELYEIGVGQVRLFMTKEANKLRCEAVSEGIIPDFPDKDLAPLACETYSNWNVDYIGLGLKNVHYVHQLSHFFKK
jgi:aryl-alcohol dehydrogenase-like predicted oxidoreductase